MSALLHVVGTTTTPCAAQSLGQLPTDCECFTRANLFVASANGAKIDRHFHFESSETSNVEALREAVELQLDPKWVTEGAPAGLLDDIVDQVSSEIRRRQSLDAEAAIRKLVCRARWSEACRSPSQFQSPSPSQSQSLSLDSRSGSSSSSARDATLELDLGKHLSASCIALLAAVAQGASTIADLAAVRHDGRRCLRRLSPRIPAERDGEGEIWAFQLFEPTYCEQLNEIVSAYASACYDTKVRGDIDLMGGSLVGSSWSVIMVCRHGLSSWSVGHLPIG